MYADHFLKQKETIRLKCEQHCENVENNLVFKLLNDSRKTQTEIELRF